MNFFTKKTLEIVSFLKKLRLKNEKQELNTLCPYQHIKKLKIRSVHKNAIRSLRFFTKNQ